jgi:biopolymer transport protein ExbD
MDIDRPKQGVRASINVTPLIDVVLVMLIIFMVLTPSLLKHMVATIPRPAPDDGIDRAPSPITVEYSERRQLALNSQPVAFEALAAEVAEKLRFDRRKLVFFKIEDGCSYGEVVKLMDTVRGAGASTLAVVTKSP